MKSGWLRRLFERRWLRFVAVTAGLMALQGGAILAMHGISVRNFTKVMDRDDELALQSLERGLSRLKSAETNSQRELLINIRDAYHLLAIGLIAADGALIADASGAPAGMPPSAATADPRLVIRAREQGRTEESVSLPEAVRRRYVAVATADGVRSIAYLSSIDLVPDVLAALRRTLAATLSVTAITSMATAAGIVAAWTTRERTRVSAERFQRLVAVGGMAASIAHEIRNPLGIIMACAESLERDHAGSPAVRELYATIVDEVDRANQQITGLLDMARDMPMRFADMDLDRLAATTVLSLQPRALAAGVELVYTKVGPVKIHGDSDRLRQAMVNLVLNAIDAVALTRGHVGLTLTQDEHQVQLSVADDGPGLPPSIRRSLGEPFVTTKTDGVGLGINITQRILERHQGRLTVDTTRAIGTAFIMSLPCTQRAVPCAS